MSMRRWINEAQRLDEVAGTYGFFRPKDHTEVLVSGDHADYVTRHPEQFGLTADEIATAEHDKSLTDPHASPRMLAMRRIINLAMSKGWVRVNYYRGAWFFQGADLKTTKAALKHYADEDFMEEAVIDVGPDSGRPEWSTSLYPHNEIVQFLRRTTP